MMPSPVPHRPLLKAYDVIIIGSGSGGAAVARRLIDKTDATVLLIEAGSAEFDAPEISDPTQWVPLGRSRHDWLYDYAPTDRIAGRTIGIPRGKVLGGSSSTNAMMWYRGHPADYDAWAAAGCDGWSFADCLPYFKRAEDWEGGETEYRGAGGPLRIESSQALHPVAQAMIDGAEELGIPGIADPNGETNEGAAPANFNIANGKRWSSATGYLAPVFGNPRLTILCNSQAIGLIIENSAIVGVRHLIGGKPVETRATTQVVLAAGAIDTPRLLTLSGIGDPMELASLGIETRHALPGVGKNLQDHPLVQAVVCRSKQPMGAPRDNGGGSMINWKSRSDLAQPDVHAFPVQGNSAEPSIRDRYSLSGDLFSIGAGLMQSRSIGHVKILSSDPFGPLDIQPNFLAEPSDLDALMVAAETMMDLAETRAFSDLFAGLAAPVRRLSKVEMIDFIRQGCSTFFHPVGTAKMGKDEMAVVDARLRLRGIDGLTIADASIIPIIPTCNTHAPVTMIGERAADFLIGAA